MGTRVSRGDVQIVSTTSQTNKATKLTNNKKDEKYPKKFASVIYLLVQTSFWQTEEWKGKPIVANLLSKNQPYPMVNESTIIAFYWDKFEKSGL